MRELQRHPELESCVSLLVFDNSPQPHAFAPTAHAHAHYQHDASNGGLAPAYNYALARAAQSGCTWLLLLDQDTTLAPGFLPELIDRAGALEAQADVAAIVPKLWAGSRLYSPEAPFLTQIRSQFSAANHAVALDAEGIQDRPLTAYNSGAAIRVSALKEIGGFPDEFWLDYLDHAVFQALRLRGYRMCIMRIVLEQKLSHMDLDTVPFWRHWSVLAAQSRFVLRFGTFLDRLFFRWWLLKTSRTFRNACRDKRVWRARARQSIFLRPLPPRWKE